MSCLVLLAFVSVSTLLSAPAEAQNRTGRSLINRAAVRQANNPTRNQRAVAPSSRFSNRDLGDELQLDTVDNILHDDAKRSSLIQASRAYIYLRYLDDFTGLVELDDIENSSLAEKALMFQGLETASQYISKSPLAERFREFVRTFKKYQKYTSVSVKQHGTGDLQVHQRDAEEGGNLLEFKLHASAKRGIEPRLKIAEDFVLRYDILENETMLEYEIGF